MVMYSSLTDLLSNVNRTNKMSMFWICLFLSDRHTYTYVQGHYMGVCTVLV